MAIKKMRANHPNPLSILRFLRVAANFTLRDLTEQTGIAEINLSHMEHGRFGRITYAKTIADFFGVPIHALVTNDYSVLPSIFTAPIKPSNKQKKRIRKSQRNKEDNGDRGEEFVIEMERSRLAGTPYENAVNGNFSDEVSAGFDVMSFAEDGHPIIIEAKSTSSKDPKEDFFMTAGEYRFLRYCVENNLDYRIFRVYNMRRRKALWKCDVYTARELLDKVDFKVEIYRVSFNKEA